MGKTNRARKSNIRLLEALKRLSEALKDLDESGKGEKKKSRDNEGTFKTEPLKNKECDQQTSTQLINESESNSMSSSLSLSLSHWRTFPTDVESAYQMMDEGANLIKATSTKYTLIGKLSSDEGSKLNDDLRKGAELVATGVYVLFSPSSGCGYSCRYYAKKTARSIVLTLTSLIQSFIDGEALVGSIGAQKTGAVWSCCDEIILKKIPRGNRSSMRRDLMVWIKECNETIGEFQEIVDLGPSKSSTNTDEVHTEDLTKVDNKDMEEDKDWDDFCNGELDQYTALDFQIAQPVLSIIKCTRGTLKCVLKACECVGEQVTKEDISPEQKQTLLKWISHVHDMARSAGEDMTDLGVLLYPPLSIEPGCDLSIQIKSQTSIILKISKFIKKQVSFSVDRVDVFLSEEVLDLANKMHDMSTQRLQEAEAAISKVLE